MPRWGEVEGPPRMACQPSPDLGVSPPTKGQRRPDLRVRTCLPFAVDRSLRPVCRHRVDNVSEICLSDSRSKSPKTNSGEARFASVGKACSRSSRLKSGPQDMTVTACAGPATLRSPARWFALQIETRLCGTGYELIVVELIVVNAPPCQWRWRHLTRRDEFTGDCGWSRSSRGESPVGTLFEPGD